jgi:hypothetical protein
MNRNTVFLCVTLGLFPAAAFAQTGYSSNVGPTQGDREFTLSGTGSSDRNFDSGNIGASGDFGWYRSNELLLGIRQSVNYASIEGESIKDDFWNGSTRGYLNYHFGQTAWRPFVGASLGAIYGDGVKDSAFAGLEGGFKYYVLPKTFLLARAEYQWFFDRAKDVDNTFDQGAWAYTVGLGYNF